MNCEKWDIQKQEDACQWWTRMKYRWMNPFLPLIPSCPSCGRCRQRMWWRGLMWAVCVSHSNGPEALDNFQSCQITILHTLYNYTIGLSINQGSWSRCGFHTNHDGWGSQITRCIAKRSLRRVSLRFSHKNARVDAFKMAVHKKLAVHFVCVLLSREKPRSEGNGIQNKTGEQWGQCSAESIGRMHHFDWKWLLLSCHDVPLMWGFCLRLRKTCNVLGRHNAMSR